MTDKCPKCGAQAETVSLGDAPEHMQVTIYQCGTKYRGRSVTTGDRCRVNQAIAICRRHASPAVGAHALAVELLKVLKGEA